MQYAFMEEVLYIFFYLDFVYETSGNFGAG